MRVNYNYLPDEFKNHKKIFIEWKKLIKTSEFTLGYKVLEFEKKFANYIGVKHCISTNNGTDAIILSLKALGIKKEMKLLQFVIVFMQQQERLQLVMRLQYLLIVMKDIKLILNK